MMNIYIHIFYSKTLIRKYSFIFLFYLAYLFIGTGSVNCQSIEFASTETGLFGEPLKENFYIDKWSGVVLPDSEQMFDSICLYRTILDDYLLWKTFIVDYNNKKQIVAIKEVYGEEITTYRYKYDNGLVSEKSIWDNNNELQQTIIYKYDNNGNVIDKKWYENGAIVETAYYMYDKNNNKVLAVHEKETANDFSFGALFQYKVEWEYDENDSVVKTTDTKTIFPTNNSLVDEKVWSHTEFTNVYTNDVSNGNVIKAIWYKDSSFTDTEFYFSNGSLIKYSIHSLVTDEYKVKQLYFNHKSNSITSFDIENSSASLFSTITYTYNQDKSLSYKRYFRQLADSEYETVTAWEYDKSLDLLYEQTDVVDLQGNKTVLAKNEFTYRSEPKVVSLEKQDDNILKIGFNYKLDTLHNFFQDIEFQSDGKLNLLSVEYDTHQPEYFYLFFNKEFEVDERFSLLCNNGILMKDGRKTSLSVIADKPTSVENNIDEKAMYRFFDNTLYIYAPIDAQCEVFDLHGRMIYSAKLKSNSTSFSLADEDKGTVFIVIRYNKMVLLAEKVIYK